MVEKPKKSKFFLNNRRKSENPIELQMLCNGVIEMMKITGKNYKDVALACDMESNKTANTMYFRLKGDRKILLIHIFDILANGFGLAPDLGFYNKNCDFIYKPKAKSNDVII